jgi:aromatic-L-amino-acid decarboxylase
VDADVATMTLLERLNDAGEVFLTHTTVGGEVVLRIAVGSPTTTPAHVQRVWTLLCEGHDWLAADFATAAAERAAEREAAARAAEQEQEAEQERVSAEDADVPVVAETGAVMDEADAVTPSAG